MHLRFGALNDPYSCTLIENYLHTLWSVLSAVDTVHSSPHTATLPCMASTEDVMCPPA